MKVLRVGAGLIVLAVLLGIWSVSNGRGAGDPVQPTMEPDLGATQHHTSRVLVTSHAVDSDKRQDESPVALPVPDDLVVACVNTTGAPVQDANVYIMDQGEGRFVGQSDAAGLLTIQLRETPAEILASTPRGGVGQAWVFEGERELTITLASGSLSGRAQRLDGLPLEAPVTVLLVPRRLTYETKLSTLLARADVVSAETDLAGSFTVDGLPDEASDFLLHCGGAGWLQVTEVGCKSGDVGLEIELQKAYGCVLELECPTCTPSEIDALKAGQQIVATGLSARHILSSDSIGLTLAGFPRMPERANLIRKSYAYAFPEDKVRVGPLSIEITAPGFVEVQALGDCVELAPGVSPLVIRLARSSDPLGQLILVDPNRGVLSPHDSANGSTALFLTSRSGARTRIAVPPITDAGEVVFHVPYGRYTAYLGRRPALSRYPERGAFEALVGVNPTRIVLEPEKPTGHIEVQVSAPDGSPYLGSADFWFTPNPPRELEGELLFRGGGNLRFTKGPYLVHALAEGDWFMKVMHPFKSTPQSACVVAGVASIVHIDNTETYD